MQSTYVDDQHRDTASLAPEWPTAMEARSSGFNNDHLASGRPSIVRRAIRFLARFCIAVLIGVGATLAWQSYGDEAREMLSSQVPSLRWLSVSTTTLPANGQGSPQNAAGPQSAPAATPAAAATTPELRQLEPMARDLVAMRRSIEQLVVQQEQMAQNIATLQAAEEDIRKKVSSRPLAQTISDQPPKPPKPPAHSLPAEPAAQSPSQSRSRSP
jgi:hypothetical protein